MKTPRMNIPKLKPQIYILTKVRAETNSQNIFKLEHLMFVDWKQGLFTQNSIIW